MTNDTGLIAIFLTGLLTGGLTCLAVQGGLLAATLAQRQEERLKEKAGKGNALPILAFLAAKLFAYTVLGALLGWFGSLFQLSITAQVWLQAAVALFMLGTALSLLNLHPVFRYFVIQPPKFLTRKVRSISKSGDIFAPALLGAFTVFIPCGTTQAMMALAIASGNVLMGVAIMFAFVLGTSPLFFILGYFATKMGDFWHKKFLKVAAFAVIILALFNLNNAIKLSGSQWSLGSIARGGWCSLAYCESEGGGKAQNQPQEITNQATITITNSGYSPREINVAAGADVKITLVNNNGYSCAQAFAIPSLKIQKVVRPGTQETVEFKAPNKKTRIAFTCSMGMYTGSINVN